MQDLAKSLQKMNKILTKILNQTNFRIRSIYLCKENPGTIDFNSKLNDTEPLLA